MLNDAQFVELEVLLSNTEDAMRQLLHILQDEKKQFSLRDNIEAIESIAEKKAKITERINEHEKARHLFLTTANLDPMKPELWLKTNTLQKIWQSIKTLASQCHKLNHVIGLVITGNKRRIEQQLSILHAIPDTQVMYSASGSTVNSNNSTTLARV